MKKMMFTLIAFLTMSVYANAMSYEQARNEALFLTDKMAYELNLTDAQYEAAYEINLDYLMGVTSYDDVYGLYWERRNLDLSYILYSWQWEAFRAASYFYRPLYWSNGFWHFGIYARYPHRDYFYFGRPHFYATYRGGHSWHMNGGRSYYHGRGDHFRPALSHNSRHFGMRNGYDRGDYRHHSQGSSRPLGSNRDNRSFGSNRDNRSFGSNRDNRSFGNNHDNRSLGSSHDNRSFGSSRSHSNSNGVTGSHNGTSHRFGENGSNGNSTGRSFGNSNTTTPRSNSVTPSRGTTTSTPSRHFGSSAGSSARSSSMGSSTRSSSMGSSTRSSSMGSSTRSSSMGSHSGSHSGSSRGGSSNSHGHFGGRR